MTPAPITSALVTTEWLAAHLKEPGIVVIDATWTPKGAEPNAAALYEAKHIPGARRFDIDHISSHHPTLPHMLPSAEYFAAEAGMLGIGAEDTVIAYDATGIASAAARAWWMFRVFGHINVRLLDGGLAKWVAEGRAVESGKPPAPHPKSFVARFHPQLVRELKTVKGISESLEKQGGGVQLVDARSAGRFEGTAPEPWAGGRGGHIPGSRSLPFTDLIDPIAKTLLPVADFKARLDAAGIDANGPIVSSCGSGVTACVLAVAMHELGRDDVAVYDGSWAEWGSHAELPVKTGAK